IGLWTPSNSTIGILGYVKYFYRESDFVVIIYCTEHGALLSKPVPTNDPTFISRLANEEETEIIKLLNHFKAKLLEAKQQLPNMFILLISYFFHS
ncbi:hypothetical protein ElyMa_001457400, partial [Elysia marginata]